MATGQKVCLPCLSCLTGWKPSVPCGSVVAMGVPIDCVECSQCQPNETFVRPCGPSADTVCARCGPDQNIWIDTKREIYKCLDCPICSSGFEPSRRCGSVVPHGEMITCVQCQEGETFSAMTDREQCKKCSFCPRGQAIVISCTKYSDTVCGSYRRGRKRLPSSGGLQGKKGSRKRKTNVECIDCPAGMEPSVACGANVKKNAVLRCVPCSSGVTYSDQRDKHACRRCTKCPPGKVVIFHCSIHHDTVCSTTCLLNQITISNKSILACVDCIKCSAGMEPAIRCGTLVNAWPRQKCIPCKTGTFSSNYGRGPCRRCRMCYGETIVKRCTKISDIVCRCKDGHYRDPFMSGCRPCFRCCNDGGDFYPGECGHLKSRKCRVRECSRQGIQVRKNSRYPGSSPSPSPTLNYISRFRSIYRRRTRSISKQQSISTPRSRSISTHGSRSISISRSKLALLWMITAVFFVALTSSVIYLHLCRRNLARPPTLLTKKLQGETRAREVTGEITLEELNAKHIKMFEWMCSKLDDGRWGRRDYERLTTKYDRINVEQRAALRCEQTRGRSPSRLLMLHIQTLYPNLPLRYLVHSLKEIGRNDIAKRLTELILEGNYGVSRSIDELPTLM